MDEMKVLWEVITKSIQRCLSSYAGANKNVKNKNDFMENIAHSWSSSLTTHYVQLAFNSRQYKVQALGNISLFNMNMVHLHFHDHAVV